MKHPRTGSTAVAPIGFSVPVLFFGPVPILMRGNMRLALITTLAWVGLPVAGAIFMAYHANRMHLKDLLRWGFCAVSNEPGMISRIEWMLGLQLPRYRGRKAAV